MPIDWRQPADTKGNSLCVGLDPRWEQLPLELRQRHRTGTLEGVARAFEEFCLKVLDLVAPLVPVVKPQSAFFEACGPAGMLALQHVLEKARQLDLIVIVDSKRNDIAATATAYAEAVLGGVSVDGTKFPVWPGDAMTINPYLGRDAVEPFLTCARRDQRGRLRAGAGPAIRELGCFRICGLSAARRTAQAVVPGGGRKRGGLERGKPGRMRLRRRRRRGRGDASRRTGPICAGCCRAVPFLVPGYGAQGGSAADTAAAFRADGLGAIINSSRGITASFPPQEKNWPAAVVAATLAAVKDLRAAATPMGNL